MSSLIIIVATSELNISETRPGSGIVSMYSQQKLAYGLSIAHAPDEVTWPDVATIMTSRFFSLKCFFSDNSCQKLVRIGQYLNTIFPCMVLLYGLHGSRSGSWRHWWRHRVLSLSILNALHHKRACLLALLKFLLALRDAHYTVFAQTHTSERTMSPTCLCKRCLFNFSL